MILTAYVDQSADDLWFGVVIGPPAIAGSRFNYGTDYFAKKRTAEDAVRRFITRMFKEDEVTVNWE